MAHASTTEEQYELVYQGICAVAAHCDGAQTGDGVGFNGQDTHFGRRVAAVPFTEWTDDVKAEAARIALTYKVQIMTYTELDMGALDVVQDAQDAGTNHAARDDARGYERRAKGADQLAARKIDVVGDKLGIFYAKKDPDFAELLETCKALPGRGFDWDLKCNVVPVSDAIADFILVWDFPITEAAQALLEAGPSLSSSTSPWLTTARRWSLRPPGTLSWSTPSRLCLAGHGTVLTRSTPPTSVPPWWRWPPSSTWGSTPMPRLRVSTPRRPSRPLRRLLWPRVTAGWSWPM